MNDHLSPDQIYCVLRSIALHLILISFRSKVVDGTLLNGKTERKKGINDLAILKIDKILPYIIRNLAKTVNNNDDTTMPHQTDAITTDYHFHVRFSNSCIDTLRAVVVNSIVAVVMN
ncbi:hypothetical protein LOAG_11133 [Loa loa]|uniref:Uncharacterized protein n=1 Tax=Loa loa TaxID=7209 RepID=A0A1S0TNG4_LOALO|nr:hypothetical protein LOAG_11133 [Loa loa]EFO17363.1 hypothetical protein LOAG_11133 [Loa loa]